MSEYEEYDSFTRADGTRYVGRFKAGKNIIEKIDSGGKRTVISSDRSGSSKSGNKNALATTFDSFKAGLEAAEAGAQLTYGDDNIDANIGDRGKNIFGANKDTLTTLELSDGSILSSGAGKDSNEIKTVKRLADEIGAAYIEKEDGDDDSGDDGDDDDGDDGGDGDGLAGAEAVASTNIVGELNALPLGPGTGIPPGTPIPETPEEAAAAAEAALGEVGDAAGAALGGEIIGDVDQSTDDFTDGDAIGESTNLTPEAISEAAAAAGDTPSGVSGTSILTSVPAAVQNVSSNTALGGEMEADAAISLGPAEDNAINMYTKGRRASILTRPGGLLTANNENEDPKLRTRRALLAG